ncbi:MAG: cbb3-type cytochrome c oxidase subunit 3 [Planctomycetota bacterium]
MRLSDVFGHLDLTIYPKIALVLFVTVFLAVVFRALRSPKRQMAEYSRMALDDEASLSANENAAGGTGQKGGD